MVGFGSESNEKNIPVKEQEMMEVGRRHRIHGREGVRGKVYMQGLPRAICLREVGKGDGTQGSLVLRS